MADCIDEDLICGRVCDSDGSSQLLSGCLRDFRNKPFPTRARVEYYLNTLTVYFHNGNTFPTYHILTAATNK
jgi:hypothetical protein